MSSRSAERSSSPSPSISNFQNDYNSRWDRCISNGLVSAGTGAVVGTFLGLLFARNLTARTSIIAAATGFGGGMAWIECRQQFLAQQTRPLASSNRFTLPSSQQSQSSGSSSQSRASPAQLLGGSADGCPVPHEQRGSQKPH